MQIDRLSLRGFRNYEDAQAQFVPGVNLLVGGNANGKTNLLEAVSYLSTGRSFRTRREAELIRFGADFAELRAQVQSQERTRELRAVLFTGRRPRQLWLAGVRQRSRAALSGVLTSVLFCPEDLMILKKGASGRRRLMDGVICQLRITRPRWPNTAACSTRSPPCCASAMTTLPSCRSCRSMTSAWPRRAPSSFRTAPAMSRRWRRRPRAITANFPATASHSS